MHRKIVIAALAVLALVLAASPALAAKAPHRYAPKHGAKCRKTYKRVKHGRKVFCVKKAAAKKTVAPAPTSPIEKTKLHSHLDPTFTRNLLNPFLVTYAFSASATQETFSAQDVRLGDEPAPLPSGVLSLFSDGKLECAINVGGSTTGSECPVSYQALGSHTVTTIYSSGEQSATETEVEDIGPLATTTTLSMSYEPLPEPQKVEPTHTEEQEGAAAVMHVGDLLIQTAVSPNGAPSPFLRCRSVVMAESADGERCYQLNGSEAAYVYERNCAENKRVFLSAETRPDGIEKVHQSHVGDEFAPVELEEGRFHLRSVSTNTMAQSGYEESEAMAPIQFVPQMPPTC